MSRTPARFTQADVARTIRAAKQAGVGSVEIRPDGTIFIHIGQSHRTQKMDEDAEKGLEQDQGVVL